MLRSIPVSDSAGGFVAIAVQAHDAGGDHGWYLVALDPRLEELDRANFADAEAATRAARRLLARQPASAPWTPPPAGGPAPLPPTA
ncbi:MAG: hypothetical protein K2X11_12090 [Acetobacteraceae bacterium]|nr:hypothetical protein [Acetobacteraceae bacterium]